MKTIIEMLMTSQILSNVTFWILVGALGAHLFFITANAQRSDSPSMSKIVKLLYILITVQVLANFSIATTYYALGIFNALSGLCLIALESFSILIFRKIKALVGADEKNGVVQLN